ncbi:MAG: DUF2314 domain-containing protein [Hamadaea sp.]|nr:DUF2314 domain-containing protein [Hamadaea sp.]
MADSDDVVTLSVPEMVQATYVVTTSSPPDDIDVAAAQAALRLPEPLRSGALQMLAGPLLTLEVWPVEEAPPLPLDYLRMFGATPAELGVASTATHVVICQAAFRPGWPPAHEWHARGVAAALAQDLPGTLIDAFMPQILNPRQALETLPDEEGRVTLTRWVLVPQSPDDRWIWMTTKGLDRYGLPELQVLDVPPTLAGPWTAALSGAAVVLLRHWSRAVDETDDPAFVSVPRILTVTSADVAEAYGDHTGGDPTATVRLPLRLDPPDQFDEQTFLTVVPPDDFPASSGEFLAQVCAELFDTPSTSVLRSQHSDEMETAIATARAALPSARVRFLAGEIEPPAHLLVKHHLRTEDADEFVWSTVTSWTDPDRLHGVSMSDAETDPTVRAGRPAFVEVADIVDWGIWIDGDGIIEGGWTNRLLQ